MARPTADNRAKREAQRQAAAAARAQADAFKAEERHRRDEATAVLRADDDEIKAAKRATDEETKAAKRVVDEDAKAAQRAEAEESRASKLGDDVRPDIVAAMEKMSYRMGSKREIRRLPEHLWENERVDLITGGTYGAGTGVLVLTDRRLLFLKDGFMSKTSEDFPLEKITSIQWSTGLLLGKMTVFASGNKAEINNVQMKDGKVITDAVRARIASGGPSTSQPPAPRSTTAAQGPDVYEQLKKLSELHTAGILTDEEFTAKKQRLLDQI